MLPPDLGALLAPVKPDDRRFSLLALRALAAAVTLSLLGGQALGTLHQLLVPHQLCAEHGHLVHANRPAAKALSRTPKGPRLETAASDGDEHAHCALAFRRSEFSSVVRISDGAVVAPPPSSVPLSACGLVELSAGPPLLSLAPKQSPPV